MDKVLDIVQSNDVVLESFVSYWFNILDNDLNYIILHILHILHGLHSLHSLHCLHILVNSFNLQQGRQ